MKKVNLLHVVTYLSDGGLEKVVYMIARNLDVKSFTQYVVVLSKSDNRFLEGNFRSENIPVYFFDFDNRLFNIKSIFKNVTELWKLSSLIKKNKIDVIHSHDFFPAFISRLGYLLSFLRFYRVKRNLVTLHNLFFWLRWPHHFINRMLSVFTDYIVCVSNAVRNYSLRRDKIKESKYRVIYNGVEAERYVYDKSVISKYQKEFDFTSENLIVSNIGVLSIRKGQKYLISAFGNLVKRYDHIRLLIFGSEREHEKEIAVEIHNLIIDLNIEKFVKIIPPRDDINKIYNIFDIYVMPSISEGQSLSAIEAMLNGRLCLFSDIEPFKEMIEDKVNGFLFESENTLDLEEKLEYLISKVHDLEEVKSKARSSALKLYDLKKMVGSYEDLYLN